MGYAIKRKQYVPDGPVTISSPNYRESGIIVQHDSTLDFEAGGTTQYVFREKDGFYFAVPHEVLGRLRKKLQKKKPLCNKRKGVRRKEAATANRSYPQDSYPVGPARRGGIEEII